RLGLAGDERGVEADLGARDVAQQHGVGRVELVAVAPGVEEGGAPPRRRAEADEAPVVEDGAQDEGAGPWRGVGGEVRAALRIVLLDRAQKAKEAGLHEVVELLSRPAVLARDLEDEEDVRAHQTVAGARIAGGAEARDEREDLVMREEMLHDSRPV